MDNISQGKRAIRELDGYELHGSALSVQESRSQPFQHSPSPLPPTEPQFNRAPASHPPSYYREPPPPDPCLPPAALYEPQYSRPASYYRGRYDPYLPLPTPHHARGWGEEHRVSTHTGPKSECACVLAAFVQQRKLLCGDPSLQENFLHLTLASCGKNRGTDETNHYETNVYQDPDTMEASVM